MAESHTESDDWLVAHVSRLMRVVGSLRNQYEGERQG